MTTDVTKDQSTEEVLRALQDTIAKQQALIAQQQAQINQLARVEPIADSVSEPKAGLIAGLEVKPESESQVKQLFVPENNIFIVDLRSEPQINQLSKVAQNNPFAVEPRFESKAIPQSDPDPIPQAEPLPKSEPRPPEPAANSEPSQNLIIGKNRLKRMRRKAKEEEESRSKKGKCEVPVVTGQEEDTISEPRPPEPAANSEPSLKIGKSKMKRMRRKAKKEEESRSKRGTCEVPVVTGQEEDTHVDSGEIFEGAKLKLRTRRLLWRQIKRSEKAAKRGGFEAGQLLPDNTEDNSFYTASVKFKQLMRDDIRGKPEFGCWPTIKIKLEEGMEREDCVIDEQVAAKIRLIREDALYKAKVVMARTNTELQRLEGSRYPDDTDPPKFTITCSKVLKEEAKTFHSADMVPPALRDYNLFARYHPHDSLDDLKGDSLLKARGDEIKDKFPFTPVMNFNPRFICCSPRKGFISFYAPCQAGLDSPRFLSLQHHITLAIRVLFNASLNSKPSYLTHLQKKLEAAVDPSEKGIRLLENILLENEGGILMGRVHHPRNQNLIQASGRVIMAMTFMEYAPCRNDEVVMPGEYFFEDSVELYKNTLRQNFGNFGNEGVTEVEVDDTGKENDAGKDTIREAEIISGHVVTGQEEGFDDDSGEKGTFEETITSRRSEKVDMTIIEPVDEMNNDFIPL